MGGRNEAEEKVGGRGGGRASLFARDEWLQTKEASGGSHLQRQIPSRLVWPSWLNFVPQNERLMSQFLVKAPAWGVGLVPCLGAYES